MNREEMKHVLFENIDLIQSRIDKTVDPIAEKVAKLEKMIEEIQEFLEEEEEND